MTSKTKTASTLWSIDKVVLSAGQFKPVEVELSPLGKVTISVDATILSGTDRNATLDLEGVTALLSALHESVSSSTDLEEREVLEDDEEETPKKKLAKKTKKTDDDDDEEEIDLDNLDLEEDEDEEESDEEDEDDEEEKPAKKRVVKKPLKKKLVRRK